MGAAMVFDGTVNLGQVFEIGIITFGIIGGGYRWLSHQDKVSEKQEVIIGRLDKVDIELQKQTDILVRLGEQGARLTSIEAQMALLQSRMLAGT